MSLEEVNQTFIDGLKEGHKWQLYIGMKLLSEGFTVQIPKLRIRPSLYHANIYSDTGDVFVFVKSNKYIFECKSISVAFSSVDDFPFNGIIVDMQENWLNKKYKPFVYLIISKMTGATFVISTSKECRQEWYEKDIHDSVKEYTKTFLLIDQYSHHIKSWQYLIDWLRERENE